MNPEIRIQTIKNIHKYMSNNSMVEHTLSIYNCYSKCREYILFDLGFLNEAQKWVNEKFMSRREASNFINDKLITEIYLEFNNLMTFPNDDFTSAQSDIENIRKRIIINTRFMISRDIAEMCRYGASSSYKYKCDGISHEKNYFDPELHDYILKHHYNEIFIPEVLDLINLMDSIKYYTGKKLIEKEELEKKILGIFSNNTIESLEEHWDKTLFYAFGDIISIFTKPYMRTCWILLQDITEDIFEL